MQAPVQKPALKKLFSNKFLTYMVSDNKGSGSVVEIEVNVQGKNISYSYTNIRDRG